ncbi:MAG: hypothetical protein SFV21_00215 [Rhodospirillaceae bacterium]|nr:hypothetical protein [Rhodospirillaceae bacterium]
MAGTKLTDAQIKATLKAQAKFPGNKAAAAKSLGMSHPAYCHRLKTIGMLGHALVKPPAAAMGARLNPAAAAEDAQARVRADDELKTLRAQVRVLSRKLNDADDLRSSIFGLVKPAPERPGWSIATRPGAKGPGTPMLFLSDLHFGETIKSNEVHGLNAFNLEIARQRLVRAAERTLDLCLHHMTNPRYEQIVVMLGGDLVSGDIHDLRETNDGTTPAAVRFFVTHMAEVLRQLAGAFKRVIVISVPGNHGRTTEKPIHKRSAEDSWDTLIAWWLESLFAGDERLKFFTPPSGDALFTVYGRKYFLTHGDKIGSGGGQGFIGPAATITRGMKKIVDSYNSIGEMIESVFVGHFHTAMELEYGFANGCLPGFSEYAKGMRPRIHRPSQWLLFAHPKHGITARWKVYLDEQRHYADQLADVTHLRDAARARSAA